MSEQNTIIPVRPVFRILGLMICIGGFFVIYFVLSGQAEFSDLEAKAYIVAFFVACPLIFSSSILGRIPFFITKKMSKNNLDLMQKSEKLFSEFSLNTFVFAAVFLSIAFFYIFIGR